MGNERDSVWDWELLRSLETAAAAAKERRENEEWLITLIAADGAQRIDRWRGKLLDRFETALQRPIQPLQRGDEWPMTMLRTRVYRLETIDGPGQATYREEIG